MAWSFSDDRPIFQQIVDIITVRIISGEYKAGERLPAVREFAVEAGVNPNTMQRAMTELERQGLVHSQRTAGRFVTEDGATIRKLREDLARTQVQDFLVAMGQLGFAPQEIAALIQKEGEKSL